MFRKLRKKLGLRLLGEDGRTERLTLDHVLDAFLVDRPGAFFVQVGAHNGKTGDPITACVMRHGLPGLLVEPQAAMFEELRRNHAGHDRLVLERAALATQDGSAVFYEVDPAFWAAHGLPVDVDTQIASLDRAQIRKHVAMFGGARLAEREDEYLVTETVPALTFASLLAKHRVERLDLLQIDAEGFDFEVLKMVDWSRWRPGIVHYEQVHLSDADRPAAARLLESNGYALIAHDPLNILAVRRS